MLKWSIKKIRLPLSCDWKISRNSSSFKENFIVSVTNDDHIGKGEVAFNVRYGESINTIEKGFDSIKQDLFGIVDLDSLKRILDSKKINNSLRCAIECAYLDFYSKSSGKENIFSLLNLKKRESLKTSFSLPILNKGEYKKFYEDYNLQRFETLKVKVSGEDFIEKCSEISSFFKGKLRIDANEGFSCPISTLDILNRSKKFNIEFIEQPFPSSNVESYKFLKDKSPFPIIADESVLSDGISREYVNLFHGVNIKLMKSGGLLKAIEQVESAKNLGLKTMVGCMIETSLGIYYAFILGGLDLDYVDLDGFLFLKEDPFKRLVERDGELFVN